MYDRLGGDEKAANVARHQDWRTVFNSLVMCLFTNVEPQAVVDLVNAACGLDWTIAELLRSGERGWNLKRVINKRLGLKRSNDTLPKTLLQPYEDASGETSAAPDLEKMLAAYYAPRGWDPLTGQPSTDKLNELSLDFTLGEL